MSCFIVSQKQTSIIARTLAEFNLFGSDGDASVIFDELRALNIDAMEDCYPDKLSEFGFEKAEEYLIIDSHYSLTHLYGFVCSYSYQCMNLGHWKISPVGIACMKFVVIVNRLYGLADDGTLGDGWAVLDDD